MPEAKSDAQSKLENLKHEKAKQAETDAAMAEAKAAVATAEAKTE